MNIIKAEQRRSFTSWRCLQVNGSGPTPSLHTASCEVNPVETQTVQMWSPEEQEQRHKMPVTTATGQSRDLSPSIHSYFTFTQNHSATTCSPQCGYSSARTKRRWLGRFVTQVTTKQFGDAIEGMGSRFSWDEGKELYLH